VGWRLDNRLVARNAADANVQKAAECQPGDEQYGLKHSIQSVQAKSLSNGGNTAAQDAAIAARGAAKARARTARKGNRLSWRLGQPIIDRE
jgi:hypothetical protein